MYGVRGVTSVPSRWVPNPPLERGDLALDALDRRSLLFWIAPVDVECRLHAGREEQRDPCPPTDLLRRTTCNIRHESHDGSCRMAEQVDRVFNAPGSR